MSVQFSGENLAKKYNITEGLSFKVKVRRAKARR